MAKSFVAALTLSLLGAACAQEPPAEPAAGPAIAFVDAFPAQAGFDRPLFVAFDASDPEHAYVVTQPGQVFAVPRDGTKADRRVFVDLGARVLLENWEEGLLGFAFDPAYADNGHVFVYWSERIDAREQRMGDGTLRESNRQSVISRFSTKSGPGGRVVDLDSELRVLEVFQPFGNHNGGTIVFGPDRLLYVALGDGGAANDPFANAQSKEVLLGKVLRIDVRGASAAQPYTIPPDNPFVGEEGARGEIWCYGLRNPWRIAFDRATGELWCGDVGQDRLEEVDRLVGGGNYGWDLMEGRSRFQPREGQELPDGLIEPIAQYGRELGMSITGGHVYRGKVLPELVGWYVYGDFMSTRTWACREDREGRQHREMPLGVAPQQIASFAEEPDGELLMTGFAGRNGRIFRLVPAQDR